MTDQSEADDLAWGLVPGAEMLHTRECPHLDPAARVALVPASSEQRETLPACASCRGILDGARRRTFASLDDALEAYQAPLENRPRIREIAAGLPHGHVWIPWSQSYIGIAEAPGAVAAAYFGKGYADVHRPGGYDREVLPISGSRAAGREAQRAAERPERICPGCSMALPATGRCDDCG